MKSILDVKNLSFGYEKNKKVLDGVNLCIEEGSITAILGKNGCGKSTLLDCIIGYNEYDEGQFETYVMINPKMISNSVEKIYVNQGEGCLSVNREVQGIIPRYARVTFEAYDIDGKKINIRAREELAIAFQHEIDHLNGIIFIDHIDPKNPFKDKENMRAI